MKNVPAIIKHLEQTRAKLVAASDVVPADRWRETPGNGGWSAGEVAAHLVMVERFIVATSRRLAAGQPTHTSLLRRFHRPIRLAEWRIFKRKSPIPVDPQLVSERRVALEQLMATRDATLEFVDGTRSRDLSVYRFPHPFLGSFNLYDWLLFLGYHELRHAKQIRMVVETFHF